MGLNGIDISSWQEDLVVSAMTTCDFVIVKATGGAGYTNECFRRHCDETLATGKLLGCYHYARDRGYEGSAEAEADHFIAAFKPYVGKAIPFLDWEADTLNLGVARAKKWLDRVRDKTGVTPGICTSKSVLFSYDWSSAAKTYPLWVTQYPNYEETGFLSEPWTDGWDFGAWKDPLIFQYTGTGRTRIRRAPGPRPLLRHQGRLAGALRGCRRLRWHEGGGHREHIEDERGGADHGAPLHVLGAWVLAARTAWYLWALQREDRGGHDQGDQGRPRLLQCGVRGLGAGAGRLGIRRPHHALQLDRRHEREMFVGSGLFSWKPVSFIASRGDIYLDEEHHTAMCIRNDGTADLLGEFSISETGGIDGEPGDQTGRESWVHDYYSGSWDGILHYNGKADVGSASTPTGSGAPSGDVSELAARVIAGDFGNGDARRAALGSRYDEVQAEVNRILSGGSSSSSYDVDALARRVIAGEFGNGDARKQALGSKYSAVQKRVNEILGASGASSTSMDVDAMARAVIRGDYGNGEERKRRLGSYYSIVQRRVNKMLS